MHDCFKNQAVFFLWFLIQSGLQLGRHLEADELLFAAVQDIGERSVIGLEILYENIFPSCEIGGSLHHELSAVGGTRDVTAIGPSDFIRAIQTWVGGEAGGGAHEELHAVGDSVVVPVELCGLVSGILCSP